ncbi:MAG: hypothetical protein KJZ78_14520 [Bryobacteraceae bacterium]|nr:hypothetical protein [Bryobacteraceae bacterium]
MKALSTVVAIVLFTLMQTGCGKGGPKYAGEWSGERLPGFHVKSVLVPKNEFPCEGQIVTQYGDGTTFTISDFQWQQTESVIVGVTTRANKRIAQIQVAGNRLSGKVTSPISADGKSMKFESVELSFAGFERKSVPPDAKR